MKKFTASRPVSKNAYNRFIEQINTVITDTGERALMLDTLDKYLAGNRSDYAAALPMACAMVFEMLRFDIDRAIARSEKARSRVRTRKTEAPTLSKSKPSPDTKLSKSDFDMLNEIAHMIADSLPAEEDDEDNAQPFVAPLTRRQRRNLMRSARPKSRWQKPGISTAGR